MNTSLPTVTGTPQAGQTLTGAKGVWSGSPTDYNYFWTRCDTNGGSCANISGASAATYTLTSADVGNTLRFKVEANERRRQHLRLLRSNRRRHLGDQASSSAAGGGIMRRRSGSSRPGSAGRGST